MGIPNYCADFEGQYEFIQIGDIVSTQAALAVDERANAFASALADTKKVIWRPDDGTPAAIMRFRTDGSDGDDIVIEMYASKGADYYTHVATLTTIQGTQDWSGGHFVDEIVVTNEEWDLGLRVQSVTNEIGRVYFNTGGFDRFMFIVTTLDPTTLYVDIARLDHQVSGDVYSALITMTGGIDLSDVVSANLATGTAVNLVRSALSDTIATAIAGVTTEVSDAASNLNSALSGYMSDVAEAITLMDSAQSDMFSTLEQAVDDNAVAVNLVRSVLSDTIADAIDGTTTAVGLVRSTLSDTIAVAIGLVTTEVSDAGSNLNSALSGYLSDVAEQVTLVRSTLSDTIATDLTNIQTEVSDASSNLKSALSGLISDNIVAVGLVQTEVSDASSNLKSALSGHLSDVVEAITLMDSAQSDMFSTLEQAVDETKVEVSDASSNLKSALSGYFSTLQTEIRDAASNLKAATTYASVWAETHSFTYVSDASNQVTSALTINGVCQKIVVEVGSNATVVGTADIAITDNEGVEIFAVDALAEASNFTYNVQEPLAGTITIGVTPGADPGQAWSVIVTMRGV